MKIVTIALLTATAVAAASPAGAAPWLLGERRFCCAGVTADDGPVGACAWWPGTVEDVELLFEVHYEPTEMLCREVLDLPGLRPDRHYLCAAEAPGAGGS